MFKMTSLGRDRTLGEMDLVGEISQNTLCRQKDEWRKHYSTPMNQFRSHD